MKTLLISVITGLIAIQGLAQTVVPFTSDRWQFKEHLQRQGPKEHVLEEYLGKPSLRLSNTDAVLKDVNFTNGIIEYDLAFPQERNFIGVNFRMKDTANFERFYIRTHQSGNPDATQYMPMFQGRESWQLYHGEGYSAPVRFVFNQWMHIRLVISGSQMEVYIGDMDKPALFVSQFKRPVHGGMLALNGNAHFANFSYTLLDKPALKSTAKPAAPTPVGTITSWQVSSAFAEKNLDNVLELSDAQKTGLSWQTLPTEPTGLVNLATGPKGSEATNTTFARVVLLSNKAQVKKLQLGFSDRARVYLNDAILFSGSDPFMSRDYRFLGTLGYYDDVYLPLKKGRNELWIAVSEEFGGWGIKGLIADQMGLTIEGAALADK